MSNALERHLRREWTPYLLANAADIHPEQVLRVLLYQDSKSVPPDLVGRKGHRGSCCPAG